jgi:uncharacterized protein YciI
MSQAEVPPVPQAYVLVILRSGNNINDDAHAHAHEAFITDLIRRNIILLGGAFASAIDDAHAAYVLLCGLDDARAIADEDPLVVNDVMRADCVEWQLVGINPEAIDDSAIIRPRDV